MTSGDLLPAAVLRRKAVVYVRQSTKAQVQTNLESQRRQYELVDVARSRGFHDIEIIDDDFGRSASGMVARPGFDRLVAWLCSGEVGAVLCFSACGSAWKKGSDSDLMQLGVDVALFSSEESASCIVPLAAPALCLSASPLTR